MVKIDLRNTRFANLTVEAAELAKYHSLRVPSRACVLS
jgi:hypothetical protein